MVGLRSSRDFTTSFWDMRGFSEGLSRIASSMNGHLAKYLTDDAVLSAGARSLRCIMMSFFTDRMAGGRSGLMEIESG